MTTKTRVPRTVALVLATGLLLSGSAGCGVPIQESPQVIEPSSVPYDLLAPGTPKPTAQSTPPQTPATATIYFVTGQDVLTAVRRSVPGSTLRERADRLLEILERGPTPSEQTGRLRSAIPSKVRLSVAGLKGDLITVDLSGELGGGTAEENITAVAQIVLSVTSLEGVRRVRLTVNRQPVDGPRGDGTLTGDPLTASDYRRLPIRPAAGD